MLYDSFTNTNDVKVGDSNIGWSWYLEYYSRYTYDETSSLCEIITTGHYLPLLCNIMV